MSVRRIVLVIVPQFMQWCLSNVPRRSGSVKPESWVLGDYIRNAFVAPSLVTTASLGTSEASAARLEAGDDQTLALLPQACAFIIKMRWWQTQGPMRLSTAVPVRSRGCRTEDYEILLRE